MRKLGRVEDAKIIEKEKQYIEKIKREDAKQDDITLF
jgi:hypothetical protein